MNFEIPCFIMRGGTSKGLFFLEKDLPFSRQTDEKGLSRFLLRTMGSPDRKQIDGLGGATSVTSKVAIVAPSKRKDADVDYTFAQVSVDKPVVSYAGNCGNMLSGVGPFAIEKGLVPICSPSTVVRIYNTNTKKLIYEKIETPDQKVKYSGTYSIAGVPGKAAPIQIVFKRPMGTLFSSVLPTGNAVDNLTVPGFGKLQVSIVDVTNPLVFVRGEDIGLNGTELPSEIDSNRDRLDLLERIRGSAACLLGLEEDFSKAAFSTPGIPKMTFVAKPVSYITSAGDTVKAEDVDLVSRMMSMQKAHPTYAFTGAMCTAAAAAVPGTIVNQMKDPCADLAHFRIGHAGGIINAGVKMESSTYHTLSFEEVYGYRTARLLMKGTIIYEPED
jgi:2-methylaconitate cis-trans-isomerase PrpF